MKNAEIILKNRLRLMEEGLLGSTGRMIKIETDEGEKEIPEPLQIHTYAGWLDLGYRVRHGQHAIADFPVWKMRPAGKRKDKKTGAEISYEEKMLMVKAFWFSPDQVEKITVQELAGESVE